MKHLVFFLFSFQIIANVSFLESINLKTNFLSKKNIEDDIFELARMKSSYLSIGESHLQKNTVSPINHELASVYFDGLNSNERVKFCSEVIESFLSSSYGQDLIQKSDKFETYKNNGPNQTDFLNCRENKVNNYFLYSGFFHQFPFARGYPGDFAQTPVITENGNNIFDQLQIKNAILISQIELEFLEFSASRNLLNQKIVSAEIFKNKVDELYNQLIELRLKMEDILINGNPFQNKTGLFISKENLSSPENRFIPSGAYILLTNLEYRDEARLVTILRNLANLNSDTLVELLNVFASKNPYLVFAYPEPNSLGDLGMTGYGTYPVLFPGDSQFLEFRYYGKRILIVSNSKKLLPSCFTLIDGQSVEFECNNLLKINGL